MQAKRGVSFAYKPLIANFKMSQIAPKVCRAVTDKSHTLKEVNLKDSREEALNWNIQCLKLEHKYKPIRSKKPICSKIAAYNSRSLLSKELIIEMRTRFQTLIGM